MVAAVMEAEPEAGAGFLRLAWQVSCDWLSRGHVTRCSPLIGPPVRLHLQGHGLPRRLQRRQNQVTKICTMHLPLVESDKLSRHLEIFHPISVLHIG